MDNDSKRVRYGNTAGKQVSMNIYHIADWFLSKEPMTHKKLQKLCYYFKAWGLALYGKDLLPGYEFQAWVHGAVSPELYRGYKDYGWCDIPMTEDNSFLFDKEQLEILDSVWSSYGEMSADEIALQTRIEEPWIKARGGIGEFETCTNVISNEDMKNYYKALYEANQGE